MLAAASLSFSSSVGALILAAGKGTRMHSDLPKVLQPLLGEPLLAYVLANCRALCADLRVVIGHGAELVARTFPAERERFVLQEHQLGTGHALQSAWPVLENLGLSHVLVMNGDAPLLGSDLLSDFLRAALESRADLAFISSVLEDPGVFGRVQRQNGQVCAVIEAKDYDLSVHGPVSGEMNAGTYLMRMECIKPLLARLNNANRSGEYYITDLIGLAAQAGLRVEGFQFDFDPALLGVNTPAELVQAEELMRKRIIAGHLDRGVFIHQGESVRIGPNVCLAPGSRLCGPCEIYGESRLGRGVDVASHCVLDTVILAEGVCIRSFSHLAGCEINAACVVGPFARLRPGSLLEADVHVGNFVEIKNSRLGRGTKAGHLSYLGDALVGPEVNIGAGVITCNFDGRSKQKTNIGAGVFIGSHCSLVAPLNIGEKALIGAGSVITEDVLPCHLALERSPQICKARKK